MTARSFRAVVLGLLGTGLIACSDGAGPGGGGAPDIVFAGATGAAPVPADIYGLDAGGGLRQLTSTTATESDPVWSADGTRIFFTAVGRAEAARGIFSMAPDGSDVRLEAVHPAAAASTRGLSPDGARVAYVDGGDLFVSDLDGANARRVAATGDLGRECPGGVACPNFAQDPRWSPDGTRLAYVQVTSARAGARPARLHLIGADGADSVDLGVPADPNAAVGQLAWAPDGRSIAVSAAITGLGGSPGNVWIIPVDGGAWQRVTPFTGVDRSGGSAAVVAAPAWAPDASRLVFAIDTGTVGTASGTDGLPPQLRSIGSDGTGMRELHRGLARYATPAWRPQAP